MAAGKPGKPTVSLQGMVGNAKNGKKITQAALGKHLDLSERSVRELFAKNVFPGTVDSKNIKAGDLDACRVSYIRHLRDQAAGRANEDDEIPEDDDPDIQLARLRREQIKGQIMKNQKADGLVVDRTAVVIAVSAAFSRVRSQMLKIPKLAAKKLLGKTDEVEVREILTNAVHFALNELAQTPIESIGNDGAPPEDDEDPDTVA